LALYDEAEGEIERVGGFKGCDWSMDGAAIDGMTLLLG
jgi:hypothetical protein